MTKTGEELKKTIEKFVSDWHWDEDSKKYAIEMGKFLFSFMDYLDDQNLSERTVRNHRGNIGLIGIFEAEYGYNKDFYPQNLEDGPSFLSEFERKVSDSKYAIQSYESTWRKLDTYIKSGEYLTYLERLENRMENEQGG